MADSLFDNRYRYDYIYPRGRSGETLRARDTLDEDRPVVIKRPAPGDAPPIRAGQEVSILNERRALTLLAGHPVLTELVGEGQFLAGGMPHQYIAMERAQGLILADLVSELAARGERLPELETLVIVDALLDLLTAAHARDIIYNDVDAKHLFWDRDNYSLKVIDWGNAVFLEGDEITPQGVGRQTDVYQVGELLYLILTGGRRAEVPRDAGQDFRIHFGEDTQRVHSRLQEIVGRALHPNTRLRYESIAALRRDLTQYRAPLERERSTAVERVVEKLQRENLSKSELQTLLALIEPSLTQDPGYPPARQAHDEISGRLRDLDVSADLDAVRIYMEMGNWARSADVLGELRERTGIRTAGQVNLLLDCALLLMDSGMQPVPVSIMEALMLIFDDEPTRAATALLLEPAAADDVRALQWRIAERISAHIPEVLLLRPNLYRLETALMALARDGIGVTEPRTLLREINTALDKIAGSKSLNLAALRDAYRAVVDHISGLNPLLQTLSVQHALTNRRLPISALDRALNAAMALADNMHVIGKQATSSPRDAISALENSRLIDPANPVWDGLGKLLNRHYDLLQSYQTYVPSADGSDLTGWLAAARSDLKPFADRLFDGMLINIMQGLDRAEAAWEAYQERVIHGDRAAVAAALSEAAASVGLISPTLAGWFNHLRSVVSGANYIERHAVQGGLGRALADGWEAFDRGRLVDSERLAQQAYEIARSESGRAAAGRLLSLARITREWVERSGVNSPQRTQATMAELEPLYSEEERAIREHFAAQMPSTETYLKAMSRGLVEVYARQGTAAVRVLFVHYLLLGTLDAHEERLDDAGFWREAAVRTLEEHGQRHVAVRTLDEFIGRRRDLNTAADLLNSMSGSHSLPRLESIRRQIEENPQARTLAAGAHSLRELEACLRDWSDGEFRAAGLKLENALRAIQEVEQAAEVTLTPYRAWLMELQGSAADLHVAAREMLQIIEERPDTPDDRVLAAHRRMVDVTTRRLGESYAAAMRQWLDTYEMFLQNYTDPRVRRSKRLERFNELFHALFIDRHPAYPLYRHWFEVTERSPEFPAPPTDEPTPRMAEESETPETAYLGTRYADDEPPAGAPPPPPGRGLSRRLLLTLLGLAGFVMVVGGLVALVLSSRPPDEGFGFAVVISETPTVESTAEAEAVTVAEATASPQQTAPTPITLPAGGDFSTPTLPPTPAITAAASDTPSPTIPTDTPTPTAVPPTATETATSTPTITLTPSDTPTPTATPTATLPPQGLRGPQNLLNLFDYTTSLPWGQLPWPADQFARGHDGSYWRLGNSAATEGDILYIAPPPAMLETAYGNNAAARIASVEVEMVLQTYNPAVVGENDVFFGLLFRDAAGEATAGVQVQAVRDTVINLTRVSSGQQTFISQRSVSTIITRLRLDRDQTNGRVTLFFNDGTLGTPVDFLPPDAEVLPMIYVKDGGVVVWVTSWRITLR